MSLSFTYVSLPGPSTLSYGQVSVGNTATLIAPLRPGRRSVVIVQHGTTDVYLGDSSVTTSNGLLLAGTKGIFLIIQSAAAIYGIVASGTQTVSYEEDYDTG